MIVREMGLVGLIDQMTSWLFTKGFLMVIHQGFATKESENIGACVELSS